MGLQEQIAEAIVIAFDELGGNPNTAIEQAMQCESVEAWIRQETAKIALAGGAEMAIPGLHAVTIPAGITFLIRKMSHISWGIGALSGCYVIETPQYSDLRNILTIWANGNFFNAHIMDHLAIGMDAFQYAMTQEGYDQLSQKLDENDQRNIMMSTMEVLQQVVLEYGGNEHAREMVELLTGKDQPDELILDSGVDLPNHRLGAMDQTLNRRISTKLALKVGERLSTKVPARLLMGFIPLAGAVVNAFFNAQTLRSMAESAQKYYGQENPLNISDLQAEL